MPKECQTAWPVLVHTRPRKLLAVLQELTTDQLVQVLVTPKNALTRQYAKTFELNQTRLHVTPKAMQAIAVIAKDKGTGARGLRSIMERLLCDAMYEVTPLLCDAVYEVTPRSVMPCMR